MSHAASLTADRIAHLVGGELLGGAGTTVTGTAPLASAGRSDVTFLADFRFLDAYRTTRAGVVLIRADHREIPTHAAARIVVRNPRAALGIVLEHLAPPRAPAWGIDATATLGRGARWSGRVALAANACLGAGARLGRDCVVGPGAVVGDGTVLGDECVVGAQAVIGHGVRLGNRVRVGPGARIGGPGFGFRTTEDGHQRLPHVGTCVIGDDVEIGANTSIDRGLLDDTVIEAGTKIDNLVQIAHNVRVGRHCIIMAQVGIAGSAVVEDEVLLAGQAGLADHVTVRRGARVAAQAGVIGEVPPRQDVSGYPARPHREVLRQAAALARLTPIVRRLERVVRSEHAGV